VTDRPRDWFARDELAVEWCRGAAARCAHLERRPQVVHVHRYDDDCEGFRHERVGTLEQLALEGFAIDQGVLGAATHVGAHSHRPLAGDGGGGRGGSVAGR